ncbi:Hypothetical_protein [Hexamita inflata]|uniref:Hypothetical_protein n=1 Tax=Hexamita inflata TaxID=28002 RepID=A0AA86P087_9EUKA|nr:Hypothetical protein HINF_LOCUS16283 [Hexamita inflata]
MWNLLTSPHSFFRIIQKKKKLTDSLREVKNLKLQILYQDWSCQIQSETELILYNSAIINKDSKMKLSARIGAGCRETTRCAVQLFHQAKMEMSSSCSQLCTQSQGFRLKYRPPAMWQIVLSVNARCCLFCGADLRYRFCIHL